MKQKDRNSEARKIKGAVLVAGNEEVGTGLLTRKLQIDLILSGNFFFDQLRLEYLQAAAQTDNHAASHCVAGLLEQAVGCFAGCVEGSASNNVSSWDSPLRVSSR